MLKEKKALLLNHHRIKITNYRVWGGIKLWPTNQPTGLLNPLHGALWVEALVYARIQKLHLKCLKN
jgi:hypothetical protein